MGTNRLTDEQCKEALRICSEKSQHSASAELGISRGALQNRLRESRARGLHLSDGVVGAINNAQITPGEAKGGWIVNVDPETGSRVSTRWAMPETAAVDVAEQFKDIFTGITPAQPVIAPSLVMTMLCTLYPIMDVHFGMQAWGRETAGQDYDISTATGDMQHAFSKIAALTPASEKAILVIGGDFFHADDNRAETPQSKHKLDVDSRHWKVLDRGIQLIVDVIEGLLSKHSHLTVRVLRGNHDEHSHLILTFALAERYRNEPRLEVEKNPHDLFMFEWGRCLISAHHGDKAKPDRLKDYLSDVCPFWSSTRHRHLFTGHIHHDSAKDFGAIKWESLRAFCPPDAYAAAMGYASRRALQSITFHKQDGAVLRAIDPIERAQ